MTCCKKQRTVNILSIFLITGLMSIVFLGCSSEWVECTEDSTCNQDNSQPGSLKGEDSTNPLAALPKKIQGFMGLYHPFKGTVYAAENEGVKDGTLLHDAFNFGTNAIIFGRGYGDYEFEENIKVHCQDYNLNQIFGIIRPPSESGQVNTPQGEDILPPLNAKPGMIQGAHVFSKLSKECPQIMGIVIDDFQRNFPLRISPQNLKDIRAALRGKKVDGTTGAVDYTSPDTTPNLKLYIVVYKSELRSLSESILSLLRDDIDGVNLWIWNQNSSYNNFEADRQAVLKKFPGKEFIPGIYINNGTLMNQKSIHALIESSVNLYASGLARAVFLFSGYWLVKEHNYTSEKRWQEIALPHAFNQFYYPGLGEGKGVVLDQEGNPLSGAIVTIDRISPSTKKPVTVARKITDQEGKYMAGVWVGTKDKVYQLTVIKEGFQQQTITVDGYLTAQQTSDFPNVYLEK